MLDSSPVVFVVLLYTWKLNWILNSSTFLKYLTIIHETNIFNFFPPFWCGITKNRNWLNLLKRSTRSFSVPRWQSHFRDLVDISQLKRLHLIPGLAQTLETSKSNWWGKEVADIDVDYLHPRHLSPTLAKHETLSSFHSFFYSHIGLES